MQRRSHHVTNTQREGICVMSKAKHPGGRPTSYRPEFCQRVVALMAEGRSLEGCAALLGVHPDSLNEWQKVHPQFSVAVRAGRAAATTYWENRLLAVSNGEPCNAQAIQWALTNRSCAASGWHHDAQCIEHSGPDGGALRTDRGHYGSTIHRKQRERLPEPARRRAPGLSSRRAADTTASSVRRWKPRRCTSAVSIPDKPATSPALWA